MEMRYETFGCRLSFITGIPFQFTNNRTKASTCGVGAGRLQKVCKRVSTDRHTVVTRMTSFQAQGTRMEIRMYVINAFTAPTSSKLGTGNPAAVALLTEEQDAELSDEARQELAAEMNLSETAFITRVLDGDGTENMLNIRWFTPTMEVDLCGHATLAGARAVMEEGWVTRGDMLFETRKKGTLRVQVGEEDLTMEFPALEKRIALDEREKEILCDGLGGVELVESFRSDYDIVGRVGDGSTVSGLKVSVEKLRELESRGVIVSGSLHRENGVRFVSRFFGPRAGISEDAVTGSAHCVLAGMFVEEGETKVEARQVSQRGGWLKIGRPRNGIVSIGGSTRVVWKGRVML